MNTSSRSALVVGGASGIGAAVVERYRADGVPVTVWDIAGTYDVECDVSDAESVDAATRAMLDSVGFPDELTVTAGIGHSGMLADVGVDEWDRVMAVNARGPWLVMRSLAKAGTNEAASSSSRAMQ